MSRSVSGHGDEEEEDFLEPPDLQSGNLSSLPLSSCSSRRRRRRRGGRKVLEASVEELEWKRGETLVRCVGESERNT